MKKPGNVNEYIKLFPNDIQKQLKKMQSTIKSAAPKSKEEIKWSMPAYSYDKILVMFAGFKNHIGFFPTPSAINAFKKDLKDYKTSKGTIQFSYDKPIPVLLVKKITAYRVKESKNVKWKEK
ncbi:MAG: iron chaperone [Candidatus Woesearchaeota archaeon]